jgi:ergothioneine biosynthesis protein EgtB
MEINQYQAVRDQTEALAAPLSAEDQVVQSMPDVSPTKWHRAHVTWFFETFLLQPYLAGYEPVDEAYGYLFNSYYEAVGDRQPRHERGLITRPSSSQVGEYRRHVDTAMTALIEEVVPQKPELADLIVLGINHEQQHQELLLMDIKHVLSSTILKPAYSQGLPALPESPSAGWLSMQGGIVTAGHAGSDFHFDNEGPNHEALLRPYRLAKGLITAGDWLDFIEDGGYEDPALWLSDGWHTARDEAWAAPLYWRLTENGWVRHTLSGERPVDPAEPVVHVSYYEADAFARWSGARLPTEFEWEAAAMAAPDRVSGLFGQVWQWTASSYSGYPGFQPAPGAVGEYNGKFMVDQQVLRGSCSATPRGHSRVTYRNFYPARSRWQFAGVRLAADS